MCVRGGACRSVCLQQRVHLLPAPTLTVQVLNKLKQLYEDKPPSTKHAARPKDTRPSAVGLPAVGAFDLSMSVRGNNLDGAPCM